MVDQALVEGVFVTQEPTKGEKEKRDKRKP